MLLVVSIASSSAITSGQHGGSELYDSRARSQSLLRQRLLPDLAFSTLKRARPSRLNRFFVSDYFRTSSIGEPVEDGDKSQSLLRQRLLPDVAAVALTEGAVDMSQSLLRQRLLPDAIEGTYQGI